MAVEPKPVNNLVENRMSNKSSNPLGLLIGAALLGSVGLAQAGNSFELTDLGAGYMLVDDKAKTEGKCGEGKCGAEKGKEGACGGDKAKAEGKCGEGKCGGEKGKEGACGGDKAKAEGKCGEGKCGGDKEKTEGKCGGAA
jgi:uncharacterized low-complexity protein